MPLNFDRLSSGDFFISNCAGFHLVVGADSFEKLVRLDESCVDKDLSDSLRRRLFLTSQSDLQVSLASLASAQSKRLLEGLRFNPTFMIVPTLRCDHTCNYCQVSRASLKAHEYDLAPSKIPQIMELVKKLGQRPYKLEIQGGEPLVRFDLVKTIYAKAVEVLGEHSFEMVITTSLSLIDEAMLAWAEPRKVGFSTSLDGTEVVHNKNRILPGNNSHALVVRGVEAINKILGPGRVATVTTVTKALLKEPESLVRAHLELGLNEMFVRPISPYGFANKQAEAGYSFEEYMDFYDRLLSILIKLNREGHRLLEHSGAIHLKRVFNPGFNSYADLKSPSGFLLDCVMFNYDGQIFGSDEARMLQRVIGNVDFSCGSVENFDAEKNPLYAKVLADSMNSIHPGCEQCAYQPFCGTDPCQSISEQGEPIGDKSISTFCNYHKAMFRYLVDRYYSDLDARELLETWHHG